MKAHYQVIISAVIGTALLMGCQSPNSVDDVEANKSQTNNTDEPTSTESIAEERYFIKNVGTGKYLNVDGNSSADKTNVSIYSKDIHQPRGQIFKITKNGNGYMLKPDCSSGVLNVFADNSYNGADVNIYKKSGSSTQTWLFTEVGSGAHRITSGNSTDHDYALTATGSSNRSNVTIQTYSSINKNQQWLLEKVSDRQLLTDHLEDRVGEKWDSLGCGAFIRISFTNVFGTPHQGVCCAYQCKIKFRDSSSKNPSIGETVFFNNKNIKCDNCGHNAGHVGIFIGNGYMIHASGGKIQKTHIWNSDFFSSYYDGHGWYADKNLK